VDVSESAIKPLYHIYSGLMLSSTGLVVLE